MLRTAQVSLLALALATPAYAGFDWLGEVALAAQDLSSADSKKRQDAIHELKRFDIAWTRPYLLRALSDPDPDVRRAAGRLLGTHEVTEAAARIVEWLADPDIDTRATAAEILGKLRAAEAKPSLIRALGDAEHSVRVAAVTALGEIGGDDVVIPLIARLEDEKASVRLAAVKALRSIGDARAVVQLIGMFADSSQEARLEAIAAVGELGNNAATPALMRLLDDPSARSAAATALGHLGSSAAVDRLIETLFEPRSDYTFRAVVATALGRITRSDSEQSDRAARALVRALAETQLRKTAREAIIVAGSAAVGALVAHLEGRLPGDPTAAVELLKELGDARATKALIAELGRGRIARGLVLEALANTGDDEAVIPIISMLQEDDPEAVVSALRALQPLVENDARAADVIVDLLSTRDTEVRMLAATTLGRMRAVIAVPGLAKIAEDGDTDKELRGTALRALGSIADDGGSASAAAVLESSDVELYRMAADALEQIGSSDARERLSSVAFSSAPRHQVARPYALRALVGIVRGKPHGATRRRLEEAAKRAPTPSAIAAIEALGAMASPKSSDTLATIARGPFPERRAAALRALGRVDPSSRVLTSALSSRDDAIAGAAALAIAISGRKGVEKRLFSLIRRGGFLSQINASAALARHAPASFADTMRPLLYHRNPAVRANAVYLLGRHRLKSSSEALEHLAQRDRSALVRLAAVRALSRLGTASKLLEEIAKHDINREAREAAKAHSKKPFESAPTNEWVRLRIVRAVDGNESVNGEDYAIVTPNGIALGVRSDSRGYALLESVPAGAIRAVSRARLAEL